MKLVHASSAVLIALLIVGTPQQAVAQRPSPPAAIGPVTPKPPASFALYEKQFEQLLGDDAVDKLMQSTDAKSLRVFILNVDDLRRGIEQDYPVGPVTPQPKPPTPPKPNVPSPVPTQQEVETTVDGLVSSLRLRSKAANLDLRQPEDRRLQQVIEVLSKGSLQGFNVNEVAK